MVSGQNRRNSRGNGGGFGGPVPIIGQPKEVEQRLKLQHLNTPNAFPVSQIVPEPDGAKLMLFGGLTKLEWMAGQVAAGGCGRLECSEAFGIVDLAASILEECQERMDAATIASQVNGASEANGFTEETSNGDVLT